jgi:hypothetical protein
LLGRARESVMSNYGTRPEPNPTPDNPLVALSTKIETLLASETNDIGLAMSALVSSLLRIERAKSD